MYHQHQTKSTNKLTQLSILLSLFATTQVTFGYDSDDCITDFTALATYDNVVDDPEDFLIDFTADICIPLLSNAENGFKTFVCSYTTLFVMEQLQLNSDYGTDNDAYIQDYCTGIQNGTQEKIFIIDKLSQLDPYSEGDTFMDNCIDQLLSYANYWYDPLIPSQAITYGDMCQAFQELFQQLEDKDISAYEDFVIYSYVLVYQMYLNSQEEQVYAKCIDSKLEFSGQSYCETSLVNNFNYTLWDEDDPTKECAYAIEAYEEECDDDDDDDDDSTDDDSTDDDSTDDDSTDEDTDDDTTDDDTTDEDTDDTDDTTEEDTTTTTTTTDDDDDDSICTYTCAYVISYISTSYVSYLTECLEEVFQTVAESNSAALTEGSYLAAGTDDTLVVVDISELSMSTSTPTTD